MLQQGTFIAAFTSFYSTRASGLKPKFHENATRNSRVSGVSTRMWRGCYEKTTPVEFRLNAERPQNIVIVPSNWTGGTAGRLFVNVSCVNVEVRARRTKLFSLYHVDITNTRMKLNGIELSTLYFKSV